MATTSTYISDTEIKDLLLNESICRRAKKWPLLSNSQMSAMWDRQKILRTSKEVQSKYLITRPRSYFHNNTHFDSSCCESFSLAEKNAIHSIEAKFPFILELLENFPQLRACGGAVFRALWSQNGGDIDLFFIDEHVEKFGHQNEFQDKYSTLLMNAIRFLADKFMNNIRSSKLNTQRRGSYSDEEWIAMEKKVFLKRSKHVTTLYLEAGDVDFVYTYQFIHRIYPNVGSILGGFDIGPCKLAFDGKQILATEFGAWSAFGRTIIVDTKTRSTSFESRIQKYNWVCRILYPGLKNSFTHTHKTLSKSVVLHMIQNILDENNYKYCHSFQKKIISQDKLRGYIERKVAKKGYTVKKLKIDVAEDRISINEIKKMIDDLALKHGYSVRYEKTIEIDDMYSQFPRFSLRFLSDRNEFYPYLFSKSSDYESYTTEYIKKKSDYDDNEMENYYFVGDMNSSMLRCNNLDNVSALLTFSKSSKLYTMYSDQTYDIYKTGWQNIGDSVINLNECSQQEIDEAYMNFFGLNGANPHFILKHMCVSHDEETYKCRVKHFFDDLINRYTRYKNSLNNQYPDSFTRLKNYTIIKLFAEYAVNIEKLIKLNLPKYDIDTFIEMITPILSNRLYVNSIKVSQDLSRVNWIVENQGRQWTSSINPIVKHPSDWYGRNYTSFSAFDSEYETQLRLLHLTEPFNKLPKDIFKIILLHVVSHGNTILKTSLQLPPSDIPPSDTKII